jgi:hypothetical protein
MSYSKKILTILVAAFFSVLVFNVLSSTRLLPSNIYASSANSVIGESLRQGKTAEDVTFIDIFKKNPYCLVDPTCVNFITNDGPALWQSEFRGSIGLNKFAWPNALLFLVAVSLITACLSRLIRPRLRQSRVIMAVACTVVVFEVMRWFAEIKPYELNTTMLHISYLVCLGLGVTSILLIYRKIVKTTES